MLCGGGSVYYLLQQQQHVTDIGFMTLRHNFVIVYVHG